MLRLPNANCRQVAVLVLMVVLTRAADAAESVRVDKDIEYLGPDRREKADLYLPASEGSSRRPAVVIIHGGGWTGGDKGAAREHNIGTTLARHDYVCLSNLPQSLRPCVRRHFDRYAGLSAAGRRTATLRP